MTNYLSKVHGEDSMWSAADVIHTSTSSHSENHTMVTLQRTQFCLKLGKHLHVIDYFAVPDIVNSKKIF